MTQNIGSWYTEKIAAKVTMKFQAYGGLLDNTMMRGDVVANTVKFPIIGRTSVYKLTGAIERVPVGGPGLSTVQMNFEDFEASDFWRVQDAYKAGPVEENALSDIIVRAVRRERDKIKIRALDTFAAGGAANASNAAGVKTIGDGTGRIDILNLVQARAELAGTGADDTGDVQFYCLLPAMWMAQLCFYKEFADARWVGDDNAPFAKAQRQRMRTVYSINFIEGPDEYFAGPDGSSLYAYMWHHDSMGAEMPWNQETPSITPQPLMQGTPYLIKAGLGGAAVGIQGEGVKRLWFSKIATPVRPSA